MARASLIPTVRGERILSTGSHLKNDRLPMPEPQARVSWDDGRIDPDNDSASFERMMRTNRAAGL